MIDRVDEKKKASGCISCYCLYSATPLMVIDIDNYSPLLSQMIVRSDSRTSVEILRHENPAIFCHNHTYSSWLNIHIHPEHNIEYPYTISFFGL